MGTLMLLRRYAVLQLGVPLREATQETPGLEALQRILCDALPDKTSGFLYGVADNAAVMYHKPGDNISLGGVHMDGASNPRALHTM
eukprot:COSAG02_NODE_2173_length_9590_cov_39.075229_3_plen_86_part_00